MSGIIDPKTAVFDTFITTEGRRQIASGKFKAEFFSFTDGGTFYALTDTFASGSQDFVGRVMLEGCNLPQDQVAFEIDDSGKLVVKEIRQIDGSMISVLNGQFFAGTFGGGKTAMSSSDELSNTSHKLLSSSIDNFNNLYLLGSSPLLEDKPLTFQAFPENFSFTITNDRPLVSTTREGSLDHIESLFVDRRLSHVPNYKFLPPVNKALPGRTTTPLGRFTQLNQQPILNFSDLDVLLSGLRSQGFSQEISFLETSADNRVVCQLLEQGGNSMTKLDVIDFGLFTTPGSTDTKHVFFAGKLFVDSYGSHTFVNMFTLVWSQ